MAKNYYLKKTYKAKLLLGLMSFSLVSEYRGNGEYKHMLSLEFLRKQILSLTYRTGETNEGVNLAMGFFESGKTAIDYCDIPSHCPVFELWKVDDLEATRGNLVAKLVKHGEV